MSWSVLQGDSREVLRSLDAESVQCVVTSPPYWGLRDYGVAGQLGMEPTPDEYVAAMVEIFREVRRVLKPSGTVFLNLGDSYNGSGSVGSLEGKQRTNKGSHTKLPTRIPFLKPKDMVGIPWMVAFALRADGWWLRSEIVWHKPNPMPQSVTDRPSTSHETVFLLSKSRHYYYNGDAVRTPSRDWGERDRTNSKYHKPGIGPFPPHKGLTGIKQRTVRPGVNGTITYPVETANLKSVWTIPTQPFSSRGEHYATFPEALPRICILAGSNEGDTILDPFSGAGTTGVAAIQLARHYVGVELNPAYVEMSWRRLANTQPAMPGMETLL